MKDCPTYPAYESGFHRSGVDVLPRHSQYRPLFYCEGPASQPHVAFWRFQQGLTPHAWPLAAGIIVVWRRINVKYQARYPERYRLIFSWVLIF